MTKILPDSERVGVRMPIGRDNVKTERPKLVVSQSLRLHGANPAALTNFPVLGAKTSTEKEKVNPIPESEQGEHIARLGPTLRPRNDQPKGDCRAQYASGRQSALISPDTCYVSDAEPSRDNAGTTELRPSSLAELSPNESEVMTSEPRHTAGMSTVTPLGEDNSNPAAPNLQGSNRVVAGHASGSDGAMCAVGKTLSHVGSSPTSPANSHVRLIPDGCLENGGDRVGTHNAEQPGKAVSDALADGLISPRSPRQLMEDAA